MNSYKRDKYEVGKFIKIAKMMRRFLNVRIRTYVHL